MTTLVHDKARRITKATVQAVLGWVGATAVGKSLLSDLRDRITASREAQESPIDVFGLLVEKLLEIKPNPKLIQIGANDGLRDDPVRRFIETTDIHAVLIEPQLAAFQRLQCRHGQRQNITLINKAVAPMPGPLKLFRFEGTEENGKQLDVWTSVDRSHLESIKRRKAITAEIATFEVPAVTLDQVLAEVGWVDLDLLVIDVEGFDFEVLSAINLEYVNPKIIQVEHRHLNGATQRQAIRLLLEHNYSVIFQGGEIVATRIRPRLT